MIFGKQTFEKALCTIAVLVGRPEADILSGQRQRRIFYAKTVLSQYLVETLGLSHRRAAKMLCCTRQTLENRLAFFQRTRRFKWKYGDFDRLYHKFMERMCE